jgi:ABC-2 type transport system ATP-binding protein
MADDRMIVASRLTKAFGPKLAVRDATFSCGRGEVVAFLGPNGAGKTTTMRMLTGYLPPTSGAAAIAGFDTITDSMQARRRLGYLPETVPLYPEMKVEDYLAFIGRLRRLDGLWDRVDDVLERVDMLPLAEALIGQLSKGLRQRVGLAQALLHDPEVLILDEPTLGLDPAQVREVRGLIAQLREKHTVLLSTHILSEAEQICNRVIMIFDGQIRADMMMSDLQADIGQTIRLRLASAPEQPVEALGTIPGVLHVSPAGDAYRLRVDTSPGTTARLAEHVVEQGWGLLELAAESLSLESVFLENLREAELSATVTPTNESFQEATEAQAGRRLDEEEE